MEIKNIVIAGTGIMGSSIAQLFAQYNYEIVFYSMSEEETKKSKELIRINQENLLKQGKTSKENIKKVLDNISYEYEKNCFKKADLVIESITEKMEIKKGFWKEISLIVKDDAILTTNTSGLSITEISEVINKPERFCGMHWVNPPHLIPLIEIIKGNRTKDEISKVIYDIALKIKRKPVIMEKELPGFLLNRFQFAILREALHIVEQGSASIEDIDKVFKYGLGMRYAVIGPFETADLGGLDVFYNISEYLFKDLADEKEVSNILSNLYKNGNYGVKNGQGFYNYSEDKGEKAIEKRDKGLLEISNCVFDK